MASIGLNIARDGSTPLAMIQASHVTWVRIVAMPDIDLREYFQQLRNNGIRILLVLARESGAEYAHYHEMYAALVTAIQIGNEADIESPSSWTMSQAELISRAREVRKVFPRPLALVCAGLASGQPGWLSTVDRAVLAELFDALAFHAYLKDAPNPTDTEDLPDITTLTDGYKTYGLPLLVTEWGWWGDEEKRAVEEVEDMTEWAGDTHDLDVFFYFCASDAMVPPFGLTTTKGKPKARFAAFADHAALAQQSTWPSIAAAVPPVVAPEPVDLRAYARALAIKYGESPVHFERQIQQESGFDPKAFNAASGATGIAQIVPRFHPDVDPFDPQASLAYAAKWMHELHVQYGSLRNALIAYNWGPGNLEKWIASGSPLSALPQETRHYLDIIMGPGWVEPGAVAPPSGRVTYNRNEPAHAQEESWDCSQESLEWALWAYGRQTSDDWLETAMIQAGVLSRADGLLDASGAGLAQFIRDQYKELGFDSNNESVVGFDALANEFMAPANPYPGLIGGRAWGHWSGLRTYDPGHDVLMLANPADGYKGISQMMTRAQFDALGPFALVRVLHKDVLAPPTVVVPPVVVPPGITRADMDALIALAQKMRDKAAS